MNKFTNCSEYLLQKVFGIFTYAVDEKGKLLSLRGFWETEDPKNSLTEIDLV